MSLRRSLITVLKLAALAFPVVLLYVQIPELRYDLGPSKPVEIRSVADLKPFAGQHSTFAVVRGKGNFDRALIYKTHGQAYLYFLVESYGESLIIRSYEKPTDETEDQWKLIDRWVGRLQPLRKLAFRRNVLRAFKDQYGVDIPADAFYLARDDVPGMSGWQIGAIVYSVLLFVGLLYFFFLRPRRKKVTAQSPASPTSSASTDPK